MITHFHVVTNLHQVVELHAVAQNCVFQSTSVNAGVGTYFNVITDSDTTELLNFDPGSLVWRKAKPIGAYHCTAVNDATLTNHTTVSDGDTRMQKCVRTHFRVRPDHDMCAQTGMIADDRVVAHHDQRTDADTSPQSRKRRNHRAGVNRCNFTIRS